MPYKTKPAGSRTCQRALRLPADAEPGLLPGAGWRRGARCSLWHPTRPTASTTDNREPHAGWTSSRQASLQENENLDPSRLCQAVGSPPCQCFGGPPTPRLGAQRVRGVCAGPEPPVEEDGLTSAEPQLHEGQAGRISAVGQRVRVSDLRAYSWPSTGRSARGASRPTGAEVVDLSRAFGGRRVGRWFRCIP